MRVSLILCLKTVSVALLFVSSVRAEPIDIVNSGFEELSRPLVGGEQTNGLGGEDVLLGTRSPYPFGNGIVDWADPVTVPGWRTYILVPFGDPGQVFAGILRPKPIEGIPFVTGIEGTNTLSVQVSLVGQKTDAILRPSTTYTLSFLGAISQFDSEYFFSVSLTAIDDDAPLPIEGQPGVTRLALGSFFPPANEPDGVMRRYELTYTTPDVLPSHLVGTRVGVHVFGSDGLPRVLYDDFELTATCAADLTCDGELDFFDVSFFLSNSVDFNEDTVFDFFDVSAFLMAFESGCP